MAAPHHRRRYAAIINATLFLLNLLLDWTKLGWIAALIWAATANLKRSERSRLPQRPFGTGLRRIGAYKGVGLTIEGDLAALMGDPAEPRLMKSVVAGARNHRELTLPPVPI